MWLLTYQREVIGLGLYWFITSEMTFATLWGTFGAVIALRKYERMGDKPDKEN